MSEALLTALVASSLLSAMPLIFAGLGESVSQQSGVLNVGLGGMMLFGAYGGFVVTLNVGSVWLGLGAGMIAGVITSLVMVVLCVWLGLDQIVVGIAIFLFAEGFTSLLHGAQFGNSYPRLGGERVLEIPLLSELPVLGESLFSRQPVFYLGIALVFVVYWLLRRTTLGLSLRAAGEKPAALDASGVNVFTTRSMAAITAGAGAGLGGAYLSIIDAGTFTPFMTQGFGFIAIVIAMLARGKPPWVIVGALLFGLALSLTTALQLVGIEIPVDFVEMLPFLTVILVLVVFARHSPLPAALALPYKRSDR